MSKVDELLASFWCHFRFQPLQEQMRYPSGFFHHHILISQPRLALQSGCKTGTYASIQSFWLKLLTRIKVLYIEGKNFTNR